MFKIPTAPDGREVAIWAWKPKAQSNPQHTIDEQLEDALFAIEFFATNLSDWELDFMCNITGQVILHKPLSNKQFKVINKLLLRVNSDLLPESRTHNLKESGCTLKPLELY